MTGDKSFVPCREVVLFSEVIKKAFVTRSGNFMDCNLSFVQKEPLFVILSLWVSADGIL